MSKEQKTELSSNYVVVFYFSVKAMSYLSHRCAKSRHLCFYRDEPIIATKTEDASFNNMGIVCSVKNYPRCFMLLSFNIIAMQYLRIDIFEN